VTPPLKPHDFDLADDSIMIRRMDGTINSWSKGAEKLYGWGKTEAQGRISHRLLQTIFPQPLAEIESELVRHGVWEGRLVHTTRDGDRLVVASRWILDREEQSGAILEVNRLLTSAETDLVAPSQADPRETRQPAAASTDPWAKANNFLAKISTGILAGGAFCCLLTLLFFLYHYQWTGERQFTSFTGVVVYQLLPALLAGFLVAALWLPPRFRLKLAMLLLSTGISVGVAEVALTLWSSLPTVQVRQDFVARAAAARKTGVPFDSRTKWEVVTDLRRKGIEAAPTVWVGMHAQIWASGAKLFPIGGVSKQATILCNEGGAYTIYESDEHGFHNPRGLWSTRVEVAALGDSFVQGFCVSSEKNFVALIGDQYPAALNLGMAGQGPLTTLATLQEYVRAVKPRVVLWFYYEGNDLVNLKWEAQQPVLMRYLRDDFNQGLLSRQAEIDHALAALMKTEMEGGELSKQLTQMSEYLSDSKRVVSLLQSAASLNHMRRAFGLVSGAPPADQALGVRNRHYTDDARDLFPRVMAQAQATVAEWDGKLYFVYLPEGSINQEITTQDREEVLGVVRRLQIPIINVQQAFRAHEDPLSLFPFRMAGHYNEAGHQLVAAEVLRSLSQSNVGR
jgi:hypothetical protein